MTEVWDLTPSVPGNFGPAEFAHEAEARQAAAHRKRETRFETAARLAENREHTMARARRKPVQRPRHL